jgi:hypothetical protein
MIEVEGGKHVVRCVRTAVGADCPEVISTVGASEGPSDGNVQTLSRSVVLGTDSTPSTRFLGWETTLHGESLEAEVARLVGVTERKRLLSMTILDYDEVHEQAPQQCPEFSP